MEIGIYTIFDKEDVDLLEDFLFETKGISPKGFTTIAGFLNQESPYDYISIEANVKNGHVSVYIRGLMYTSFSKYSHAHRNAFGSSQYMIADDFVAEMKRLESRRV